MDESTDARRILTAVPQMSGEGQLGRAPVVKKKEPERRGHGERERAYNGGLGAEPPAGSRGRPPGRGVSSPP